MLSHKNTQTDEIAYSGLFVAGRITKKIPGMLKDKINMCHVGLISNERPDYPVDDYYN